MAQFDPRLKREWWVFQEIGNQMGKSVYRRLRYNFVSYDDDPDRMIEPIPNDNIAVSAGALRDTVIDANSHFGRIAGIEYFAARPHEVHSFDDVAN